ncbi:MAG: selenide, water dikinase SelD [Bacteroidales bacterium]|nr:selenide, water dikinase SelD [Bacteroidales bacterium]
MSHPIYLDYNATTPIAKEVAESMKPYLEHYFGNPSSVHSYGQATKQAVEKARKQVATMLNCKVSEIIFTSGGTESNNYAIKGTAYARQHEGKHLITSMVEHPAVLEVFRFLEKQGFDTTYINVDNDGVIKLDELKKAIRPDTILISVMHANNEVGTIQPIAEIAELAKQHQITFHCDGAQSVGKIATDVNALGIDLFSLAGHKLYAPKGIGAIYIKTGTKLEKLMHGADHEQNLRAGTENVLEIVGLGKAAELAYQNLTKNEKHYRTLRDRLWDGLKNNIPDIKLNGHVALRLPNTLSVSFPKIEANTLLDTLEGVAASAGTACHSDNVDISHVLEAMFIPMDYAMGTIRFSTGIYTTETDIDEAIKLVSQTVELLSTPLTEIFEMPKADAEIKLTHYTHGLGCACKIRPQYLERVLADLPVPTHPNIIVGSNTADDAAVYKIDDSTAWVSTVDFFTPIVDNPYDFGAIAVANSLSDVYAMGARPLFGLNIVGFPDNRLPMEVLQQILRGANDKATEAGVQILGGHTVEDTEPKYGMAVSGIVHPDKIWKNSTAQVGDVLILTKAIGSGILSTAMKRGKLSEDTVRIAIATMAELNGKVSNLLLSENISACTDITGFGLMGHLKEMTVGSQVDAEIYSNEVLLLPEVEDLATAGVIPGGTKNNMAYVEKHIKWGSQISNPMKYILCDAQTSGGLLLAVPSNNAERILEIIKNVSIHPAKIIGKILKKGDGYIRVN